MKTIFVSYSSDNITEVEHIVKEIEKNRKCKCWYARRDITAGPYSKRITEAIGSCDLFLLILSDEVLKRSDQVLNELEIRSKSSVDVVTFTLSDIRPNYNLPDEFHYYIGRYQFFDGSDFGAGINNLKTKIFDLLEISAQEPIDTIPERETGRRASEVAYSSRALEAEAIKRLRDQNRLLDGFLGDIYSRSIINYNMANILDVGSNDGSAFYSRVGNHYNINIIIGLEYNQELVERANSANRPNAKYYCVDIEAEDFEDRLIQIRKENGLGDFGFDIINLSMILLHLKNPLRVIRTLKKFLKPNGIVVVLDIDDKLNLAFPDSNGLFQQCFDIVRDTRISGGKTRYCGREVFHYFRKAGFSTIRIVKQGLCSAGLKDDLKEALFRTYFAFTKKDYEQRADRFLDKEFYDKNAAWYKSNYVNLSDQFMDPDFFFSLGFMIYTVQN